MPSREELRERNRLDYLEHRDERRVKDRNRQIALKQEVLGHYGNGKLACVNCGFDDIRALSIDHINGGGRKHIRGLYGRGGAHFYRLLRRNGYPEGYQTLCMNCQWVKRFDKREWGKRCSPIGQ